MDSIANKIAAFAYAIPVWLVPLIVGACLFPISGTVVTPDGASYLSLGYNLYHGLGYVNLEWNPVVFRGPVFSGLIALAFSVGGPSVSSALGLTRLFFVLNGLLVYAITSYFTNRLVGLFASLLMLTSTTIYVWSARVHYDNIVPFFMLLSSYLFIVSLDSRKKWMALLSGIMLGCAVLTKDVAILWVMFPIILWCVTSKYRTRESLINLGLFLSIFCLICGSWFAYVYTVDGLSRFSTMATWVINVAFGGRESTQPLTDTVANNSSSPTAPQITLIWAVISQQAVDLWSRLNKFYEIYVAEMFAFAILFVCAWAFVFLQALRKRSAASLFLTLSFILFLPLILFLGEVHFRAGQNVYLYILSYIALAYSLWGLTQMFSHARIIFYAGALLLLMAQIFYGKTAFADIVNPPGTGYIAKSGTYGVSWQHESISVGGWHDPVIEQAGKWLQSNVAAHERVLTDWEWGESFYFYLGAQQPLYEIKYIASQNLLGAKTDLLKPVSFVWTQAGRTNPSASLSYLNAFSESLFLSEVREQDIDYVIFGERRNFLSLYMRTHPDFIQVAEFDNGRIQIFQVIANAELNYLQDFPLFASDTVKPYLQSMQAQHSGSEYEKFVQSYFYDDLNFTEQEVNELVLGSNDIFRFNTIFSHRVYASYLRESSPSRLLKLIETHQEQTLEFPDNPWAWITLAYLYHTNDQSELAQNAYAQALSIADVDPLAYSSLISTFKDLQEIFVADVGIQDELVRILQHAIDTKPTNVQTFWQLAEVHQFLDAPEAAQLVYKTALSQHPNSAGTMFRLARSYLTEEQYEDAKDAYMSLLDMSSDDPNLPSTAEIHMEIGKILLAQKQGRLP